MEKYINEKDIFNNILSDIITYHGIRIESTFSASRELIKHSKDLFHVVKILNEGYNCGFKRKKNIIEKCYKKGNKEFKVVIGLTTRIHPDKSTEEVWRLIHFGVNTYKK